MIRINLLGVSKPKKRSAASMMPGVVKAPPVRTLIAILALLTIGGNYFRYWRLDSDAQKIAAQMAVEEEKNRRLADIKAKYLEMEKQKNQYEHRVNVINELAKSKKGPSDLLSTIAETVNRTDAVWLNKMHEEGNNINLEGMALSVNAVANLMSNLRNTGYFRTIEMRETVQDETVKDMQAFVFTLVCERQAPAQQKS